MTQREFNYPFQWTGVYRLEPGRYDLSFVNATQPSSSLVLLPEQAIDEGALQGSAERCVSYFREPALPVKRGAVIPTAVHVKLDLSASSCSIFELEVAATTQMGFFFEHSAESIGFGLKRNQRSLSFGGSQGTEGGEGAFCGVSPGGPMLTTLRVKGAPPPLVTQRNW